MKKLLKKTGIVPVIALSVLSYLVNPISLSATDQKKKTIENRIYSSLPENSASGEGVALKDFVYDINLNSDSNVKLDEVFGLYAKKGDIQYNVIDAQKGLKNIIVFLEKNLNSRDAQSKSERIATINHYKNLLQKTSESDISSLNNLEKAVQDGVIDVRGDSLVLPEGWKIKEGKYVLVAKSKSLESGNEKYVANSIPLVVNIKFSSEKPSEIKHDAQSAIRHDAKRAYAKERVHAPALEKETHKEYEKKEDSKKIFTAGLILEAFGGENGLKGAGVGLNYGPLALVFNYAKSNDLRVNEVTVPLSVDRYGYGTEDHVNFNSIGAALEVYPVRGLFLGAGGNRWNYTDKIEENILSGNGEVIKTNTNSKSAKEYSARGYLGVEIPVKKSFGLRFTGGYDTKKGLFGGAGLNIKLNKRPGKNNK